MFRFGTIIIVILSIAHNLNKVAFMYFSYMITYLHSKNLSSTILPLFCVLLFLAYLIFIVRYKKGNSLRVGSSTWNKDKLSIAHHLRKKESEKKEEKKVIKSCGSGWILPESDLREKPGSRFGSDLRKKTNPYPKKPRIRILPWKKNLDPDPT